MKASASAPLYFLGMGGFAKEILAAWSQFILAETYYYAGFFDDDSTKLLEQGYQGPLNAVKKLPPGSALLVSFVDTIAKQRVLTEIDHHHFIFPNAINLQAQIGPEVQLGKGNIICAGCILTTQIALGDFNVLNHYVTIGHHSRLGTGNALMTKAHLSGYAQLGDYNLLAVGASILQGKGMGNFNILGPHACLMNTVGSHQTYLGIPALAVK